MKYGILLLLLTLLSCTEDSETSQATLQDSPPITLTSINKDTVLSGLHFSNIFDNGTHAIEIIGNGPNDTMNIEITDCLFENIRWAVHAYGVCNISIHGNRFVNCGDGVIIDNAEGIQIEYNEFTNIGELEVLDHGYGNYWAQQAAYFIEVRGAENSISYNIFDYGDEDNKYLEDIFGLWNSGGESDSYLQVVGNKIRGGIPGSRTGTGIIAGDAAGASTVYVRNINIAYNTIVNAQSSAIFVGGGTDIIIANNKAYTSLAHSKQLTKHPHNSEDNATPGGGIMIFDYSQIGCSKFTVENNEMFTVRSDSVANPWWFDTSTCSDLTENTNIWHWNLDDSGTISDTILPQDMFADLSEMYFSARH